MTSILPIQLHFPGFAKLQIEAQAEGCLFIDRLYIEWADGSNRYQGPGEALIGAMVDGKLVAVGGLNCDPFAGQPDIGRLRRIYVRSAWRRRGIGEAIVLELIRRARVHFSCLRLRAENDEAARLYERLGFSPIPDPDATHILRLDQTPQY
jgi:GNAT superfamily N-acetyltransferase